MCVCVLKNNNVIFVYVAFDLYTEERVLVFRCLKSANTEIGFSVSYRFENYSFVLIYTCYVCKTDL